MYEVWKCNQITASQQDIDKLRTRIKWKTNKYELTCPKKVSDAKVS